MLLVLLLPQAYLKLALCLPVYPPQPLDLPRSSPGLANLHLRSLVYPAPSSDPTRAGPR